MNSEASFLLLKEIRTRLSKIWDEAKEGSRVESYRYLLLTILNELESVCSGSSNSKGLDEFILEVKFAVIEAAREAKSYDRQKRGS